MKTEKIPLAIVYKEDGMINIDFTEDSNNGFEVYGFLKCFVKRMEDDLIGSMENK